MIFAEILNNNKILIHEKKETTPISDSVKFESVKFGFPRRWKGYSKTVVFTSGKEKSFNILLSKENPLCLSDEECYIPHEILLEEEFYLSVFGVLGDSIATTPRVKITVAKSGYALGDEPSEPTQNEYQQIIEIMEQTKQIAQSVRDDADNGLFDGKDGEKGEKGDKGDKGEDGQSSGVANADQSYNPESQNAVSAKALSKVFAASIRSEKSGEFITIVDISPTTPEIDILAEGKAGLTVCLVGKNLFDGLLQKSSDGKLYAQNVIRVKPNTDYVISEFFGDEVTFNVYGDAENTGEWTTIQELGVTSFNSKNARYVRFETSKDTDSYGFTVNSKFQFEEGTVPSDFEEYTAKSGTTDENGKLSLVANSTEITNVFADEPIVLNVKYSADTKKYVDAHQAEDGHTPVRNVDYWTEEDKAEIKSYVDDAILGGAW